MTVLRGSDVITSKQLNANYMTLDTFLTITNITIEDEEEKITLPKRLDKRSKNISYPW
jgi:hypothetical protein